MNLILADAIAPVAWRNGGGHTRELWVDAPGPGWRLRISLADIAQDGPFSAFPGVQRHFAVLQGAGVVLDLDDRLHTLTPDSPPLAFDGALAPGCRLIDGPTRDLNLMLQGGASGSLQRAQAQQAWGDLSPWRACFVTDPAALHLPGGATLALAARCLVVGLPPGPLRLQPSGPGPSFWLAVAGLA